MTELPETIDDPITRTIEAVLFASETPLTVTEISNQIGAETEEGLRINVRAALRSLEASYAQRGINLVERDKRWHFQTAPDLAFILRKEREETRKLSRAAIETLAIIAYHEPVSRAEIEAIRGVQISSGTLDVLMAAHWVKPAGRREVAGRPLIYTTTSEFLVHFGLTSRRDLPGIEDLRAAGLLDPVDLAFESLHLESHSEEA